MTIFRASLEEFQYYSNQILSEIEKYALFLRNLTDEQLFKEQVNGKIRHFQDNLASQVNNNRYLIFTDPNNIIVARNLQIKLHISEKGHNFFIQSNNDKIKIKLISDLQNFQNFIPLQIPIYNKEGMIEDFGKIEFWEYREPVLYTRYYIVTPSGSEYYAEIASLPKHNDDPYQFQHHILKHIEHQFSGL